MRKFLIIFALPFLPLMAKEEAATPKEPFTSFTGQITKNKVRLRTQPTLDAPVVKELSKNDMLIVTGENDDFYIVLPPATMKAYIFRTFVLENTVEGTRVNVRLEPSVDAPTVAQLNTGDRVVNPTISPLNSKWYEIQMPESARFYIAKEFVDKAGDVNLMAQIAKKRDDVNSLLESTYTIGQQELAKPYPEIKLDGIIRNYQNLMNQEKDFPDQAARAKELLKSLQEAYLQKKIAYLEQKASENKETIIIQTVPGNAVDPGFQRPEPTAKMSGWNDQEQAIYLSWAKGHPGETVERFYEAQKGDAKTVVGILEAYNKNIRNKPGDYVLLNKSTKAIIAYVYSNRVNLENKVGQDVTLRVAPRPNNNFAFPAYFVLEAE